MIRILSAIAAVIILTLASAYLGAQADPSRPASIVGFVFDSDTTLPVPSATVRLVGGGTAPRATSADEFGRFEFTGVAPGRYIVTATMGGYAVATHGQQRTGDVPSSFALRPGETRTQTHVWLTPLGRITGQIVDEMGSPTAGVQVQARRQTPDPNRPSTQSVTTTTTDRNGEFTLKGLASGRYFVLAVAAGGISRASLSNVLSATDAQGTAIPTYHPGTIDPDDAVAISVDAGAETQIVLGLLSGARAGISGIVLDSAGRPAVDHVVVLTGRSPQPLQASASTFAEIGSDGEFTFPRILPGSYIVDVRSKAGFEAVARSGRIDPSAFTGEFASRIVHVASGEDIDLLIQTGPGFEIAGRVTVDGGSLQVIRDVTVSALPATDAPIASAILRGGSARVDAKGSFTMPNLAGRQMIRVSGLPAGWALKRVSVAGTDVTDEGIDMAGNASVEVVVGKEAEVLGRVVDEAGAGVPGASVFAFSEDAGRWRLPHTRFVASTIAAADGRFALRGLPPGRYRATALVTEVEGRAVNVENFDLLAASATPFSLDDGGRVTLTLRIH